MDSNNPEQNFVPVKRVIMLVDLAGAAKAMQSEDVKMVQFIQDYYAVCDKAVTDKGGTVIKFMGDGCLAVFSAENARNAVNTALELRSTIAALAGRYSVSVTMGANLHLASVVDAEFGVGSSRRRDIMGRGVNQAFLLGRGPGIRISEPVYRALPSGVRSPWIKHKPPAVYHIGPAGGIMEGLGKTPSANAARW
jgi:class 3 adenylate cyclase